MQDFTPIASSIGGILIGLAAAIMLLFNGRIAGISGIFEGFVVPDEDIFSWKAAFIGGLIVGGAIMSLTMSPQWFAVEIQRSTLVFFIGGTLVGFGTRLGNGCTSGHGVCGMSRFSQRSIIATLSFILSGGITVYIVQHVLGGTA